MPPVKLIQIGNIYYVRDGHHRISVARAMGQESIKAEVAVWRPAAQPSPALTAEAGWPKAGVAEPATCVGVWSSSAWSPSAGTNVDSGLTRNQSEPTFLADAFDWVEFQHMALRRQQKYLAYDIAVDVCRTASGDGLARPAELADGKA